MARPFVRRAVELSGGSIIDVVRRGEAPVEPADHPAVAPDIPVGDGDE